VGLETGPSSSSFDPFSSAILNTYLLNYNYTGGMATYDFYAGYVELAARMFGGYLTYTFNPVTKLLKVTRDFKGTGERILIWADVQRPELELLQDPGAGVWIGDYILAVLKGIIGEAREKFQSIAGPGGGTEDKPVGTVWIAVASNNKVYSRKFQFGNQRLQNIERTAIQALWMLFRLLREELN
jgi:hypothetical protein